jgi:hypothetical protein
MRVQRRANARVTLAELRRDHRHPRIEQKRGRQRQSDDVVELCLQIRTLQLRGQQLLAGLERPSAALDEIGLERAAVSHLLDPLALHVFRRLNLRQHRPVPDVGNQNPVVDLVDPQRRLVLDGARLAARSLDIGQGHVVRGLHPEQLCQRLNNAGSVGDGTHAALVENQRARRHRKAADDAEPAGRNFDQLRIREADHRRVVCYLGKVRALRRLLRVVLLVNRQLRETDRMIARER